MRTRLEILNERVNDTSNENHRNLLLLEILLDIRDALSKDSEVKG